MGCPISYEWLSNNVLDWTFTSKVRRKQTCYRINEWNELVLLKENALREKTGTKIDDLKSS